MGLPVELCCEGNFRLSFVLLFVVKKLIKDTIIETYCVRHCCQDTPKRSVHAEGGDVSTNTEVKSEDTEITDTRSHRHLTRLIQTLAIGVTIQYVYQQ